MVTQEQFSTSMNHSVVMHGQPSTIMSHPVVMHRQPSTSLSRSTVTHNFRVERSLAKKKIGEGGQASRHSRSSQREFCDIEAQSEARKLQRRTPQDGDAPQDPDSQPSIARQVPQRCPCLDDAREEEHLPKGDGSSGEPHIEQPKPQDHQFGSQGVKGY